MRKELALMCGLALCLGCQTGSQRQLASSPPAGPAPTINNNVAESTTPPSSGFSIGRVMEFVGFRPAETEPAPVAPEVARLNELVTVVTTKASQLNINDPPAVTRQKAQDLLASLREWETALAAGRAVGLLNESSSQAVRAAVSRLAGETQKLVQYAPRPETISAVQQLASQLGAVMGGINGLLSQGSTISQALLGTNRG